jgi:NADH-quinone oxidoreductase subunit J
MVKCLLPMPELSSGAVASAPDYSSLQNFAMRLLGYTQDSFIIPFEVVSVLLLITLICAITIARKTKDEVEKEKEVKQ